MFKCEESGAVTRDIEPAITIAEAPRHRSLSDVAPGVEPNLQLVGKYSSLL